MAVISKSLTFNIHGDAIISGRISEERLTYTTVIQGNALSSVKRFVSHRFNLYSFTSALILMSIVALILSFNKKK